MSIIIKVFQGKSTTDRLRVFVESLNNHLHLVFLFFIECCFKPSNLGLIFYLFFCKKFLQARYLFVLFRNYLLLKGISLLHLRLQWNIFLNWLFLGRVGRAR